MSRAITLAQYDEALSGILNKEGQIAPFLDVIFGFLYRKTDFFQHLAADGKSGFLPGATETLIENSFRKYKSMLGSSVKTQPSDPAVKQAPPIIKTADIRTEQGMSSPETGEIRLIPTITAYHAEDPGNGAVHDKFAWNQTINDLDVKIYVPKSIAKSKQLQVELTNRYLKVADKDHNEIILEGSFSKPVNSAESMWILVPREYIQITLEKEKEAWWDCLLEGEGKIDLEKINAEISFVDMKSEEQQLIRKMMCDQQLRTEGKSTSDQVQTAETLKVGWNAEPPPFHGLTYNPPVSNNITRISPEKQSLKG